MALTFRKKKQGTKPIYVVLSIFLLLITASLLTVWLIIGYHRSAPPPEEGTETTTAPTYAEQLPETESCLVILKMSDHTKFVLVQTNPEEERISAVPVPPTLADENKIPLPQLLERNGSARVAQTVAEALELSVKHYVTLDASGINEFLSDLDQGISLKLPQDITYTDANGLSSTVHSGKRELTTSQAVAALEFTQWKKKGYSEQVAAELIASLFNRYLVTGRSIRGYFGGLANVAQTDLRIDHFTAYSPALDQLAEANNGSICSVVTLDGKTKNGRFVPDLDAIRRKAGLHPTEKEGDR